MPRHDAMPRGRLQSSAISRGAFVVAHKAREIEAMSSRCLEFLWDGMAQANLLEYVD